MGAFTGLLLAAAVAQGGGFSFKGTEAGAKTTSSRAFVATGADPTVEQFEDAQGEAVLQVRDRVAIPAASYGDQGDFSARVRLGLDEYRIELIAVGAPPVVNEGRRLPFAFPTEGGVRLADVVFGRSGIGIPRTAPARSGIALFGTARIVRNGLVVDEAAPVQLLALATGVHADDDTHRRLRAARAGDNELWIYVPEIRSGLVPNRYLLVVFEDVALSVAGRSIRAFATVPTEQAGVAGVVPSVENLAELTTLEPPAFEGFRADAVTRDEVPADPIRPPRSVDPLNSAPSAPLPRSPDVVDDPLATNAGPIFSATQPASPLPQGITPGNAQTDVGIASVTSPANGPVVSPLNSTGAPPLFQTVTPLTATGAGFGPGITTAQPFGSAGAPTTSGINTGSDSTAAAGANQGAAASGTGGAAAAGANQGAAAAGTGGAGLGAGGANQGAAGSGTGGAGAGSGAGAVLPPGSSAGPFFTAPGATSASQ